jgi:hypothetical protein
MVLLVSIFLLAVGLALLELAGLLLMLKVWLLALLRLLEGRFVRAGWWLCLALVPFNLFSGRQSYVPLYVAITVLAVVADVWKHARRIYLLCAN